jgi:DNA mismatch endonuclease, patch repair protein
MHSKKPGHRSWAAGGKKVPGKHRGDIMSVEKRSALMARIRGKNTGPEQVIGKELANQKLRFESHPTDLPGRPDIVFRPSKVAVFIDGDFWHGWRFPLWQHKLSKKWRDKITANRIRDAKNFRKLRHLGWKVIRIWEHQTEREPKKCVERILAALELD